MPEQGDFTIPTTPIDMNDVVVDIGGDNRNKIDLPQNVDLSTKDWKTIETRIGEYMDGFHNDSGYRMFMATLAKHAMAIEGVFDSTKKKPWKTASEVVSPMIASQTAMIANAMRRTLGIEPFFMGVVRGNKDLEKIAQDFINDRAKYDFDYLSVLDQMCPIATETPGPILNPEWVREVRRETSCEYFESLEGFKAKYPTAKDAGLTDAEYTTELDTIKQAIEEYGHYECTSEFDKICKNGPVVNVIHPADFVIYPFGALTVELAKLVGAKIHIIYDDIVRNERLGLFIEDSAQKIKKFYIPTDGANVENPDEVQEIQESTTGAPRLTDTLENYRTKDYTIVKGLIRLDLYDDGTERDYEYQYSLNERILLRLAPSRYHFKERNYFPVQISPKSKSFWGRSLPQKLENGWEVESTLLRQLLDSNTVANVPTFVASAGDKQWFEDNQGQMQFEPGAVWWLRNPGSLVKFDTKSINAGDYLRILQ